jgi:nitroimidazol reductase NimA-like FMN-containing flavoprotein (pyridoxamine 5'-phosphate oxidase superfamily)
VPLRPKYSWDAGHYDYDTIHSIIDKTPVLHVSFPPLAEDPFPAILPMLGCTGVYDEAAQAAAESAEPAAPGAFPNGDAKEAEVIPSGPRSIYLHGHSAARMFQITKGNEVPVAVAATTMQGIVLSLTPFHNSCNYASAVVHGYASVVTSEAEHLYALTRITNNLIPERWENSRNPPTNAELTSTGVVKVTIVSASAKVRIGGPSDDRPDLRNEELINSCWTGVVPTWTTFGEPVPSSYNKLQRLPGYMREWINEENHKGKAEALAAIEQVAKKK